MSKSNTKWLLRSMCGAFERGDGQLNACEQPMLRAFKTIFSLDSKVKALGLGGAGMGHYILPSCCKYYANADDFLCSACRRFVVTGMIEAK